MKVELSTDIEEYQIVRYERNVKALSTFSFDDRNDFNSTPLKIGPWIKTNDIDWKATGAVDVNVAGVRACPLTCNVTPPGR